MTTFFSTSAQKTKDLSKKIAHKLKGGEVLLLQGNLGVGKTEFVKGLATELGIKTQIVSPTYVLQKNYQFKKRNINRQLHHFDFYRLKNLADLTNFGFQDLVAEKNGIIVIEWPEKIRGLKKILPKKLIKIKFEYGREKNSRKIQITNHKK